MVFGNRRGVIEDLKFILITVFTFIMIFGISIVVWNEYVTNINNIDGSLVSAKTKAEISEIGSIWAFVDTLVPFLFLGLWAIVIFFSISNVPDHPFFFIISFASLLIVTLLSIGLTDLGVKFFQDTIFDNITSQISNSLFFVNNFHYISFAVMLFTLVIFYSRNKLALTRGIQ